MRGLKQRVRLERTDNGYGFSLNFRRYEVILTTATGVDFFEKILEAELFEDNTISLLWVSFLECVGYNQYECCLGVAWCVVEA